ncbi:hypothetical protein ACH47C_16855 [Streptomyces rishiriensis]|uniref:hypothetical protein n=1 Tax=Streptomyces rishiriensis TaxID=68264 RepID=UPI0035A23463
MEAFDGAAEIAEARDLARSFLTDVQAVHGLPVSARAMAMEALSMITRLADIYRRSIYA